MTVTEVNQLAKRVVEGYRFDIAMEFLQSPTTPTGQAVWILYKISKLCRADQAGVVSHLISEFVPEATSPNAVRSLRRYEFQMYRRLGLRHGVEKCLRRYISLSSEGRELLKSLGRNGRLLDG